jgi:hypothetical protein
MEVFNTSDRSIRKNVDAGARYFYCISITKLVTNVESLVQFIMVLLLGKKKISKPLPTYKENKLFVFYTTTNNNYLLITSGIGVGVQQTMQWRPSSNHLCVCNQYLYTV